MTKTSVYGRLAVALPLVLGLGGCGFNLVDLGPPPNLYDLQPEPDIADYATRFPWQLAIEEPSAVAALDTDRIIVRPSSYEVKYYAGARWTDRAPLMVQAGLVEAFERTGALGVGRLEIGLRGDYNLKSELRAFDSVIAPGDTEPTIRVRLNLKIIRQPTSIIVASRTFEAERKAASGSIVAVVNGFELALTDIFEQSVDWTLRESDTDYRSLPGKRPVSPGSRRVGRPAQEREDALDQGPQGDVGLPPEPPPRDAVRPSPAVGP